MANRYLTITSKDAMYSEFSQAEAVYIPCFIDESSNQLCICDDKDELHSISAICEGDVDFPINIWLGDEAHANPNADNTRQALLKTAYARQQEMFDWCVGVILLDPGQVIKLYHILHWASI